MSDDEIEVPAIKKQRIFYGSLEETIRALEQEHLKKSESQQNINVSDGNLYHSVHIIIYLQFKIKITHLVLGIFTFSP